MPRDGSNVYHIPPGTYGIPDTTIESDKYNRFADDVALDLNTPRPISAGGTGAASADAGLAALGGETASQIVTNYDSEVFKPGSFYSHGGATSEPVAGHDFSGYCALNDIGEIVIVATDLTDPYNTSWTRVKFGGTWSTWTQSNAGQFILRAGDAMTGNLQLHAAPVNPLDAASKAYVDARMLVVSDTAPASPIDGMFWWDSANGLLFVRYNDGDSTQWVIACPQPDIAAHDALMAATYAPINNAVLTGDPQCPTPSGTDNDTSIANTGWVQSFVAAFVSALYATAAQYLANVAGKILTTDKVWAAATPVMLTDGATVTPDFNTGIDFVWTIGAAGRTLANPTNAKLGQKGLFYLIQDGTGNRTITSWGTSYKFPAGVKPTLSTAAGAVDIFSYAVGPGGALMCFPAIGMA